MKMVPVVSKFGKQKPPTPPKPVQYQPVDYRRLIDNSKFTPPPLLQLGNENFNTILDRSLTDDTVPLIGLEEEPQQRAAVGVANRVKPPLLPKPLLLKPLHIATKPIDCAAALPVEEKRNTNPFVEEQPQTERNRCTNPFKTADESLQKTKCKSTNPFESYSSVLTHSYVTQLSNGLESSFEISNNCTSLDTSISNGHQDRRIESTTDFHSLGDIHKQFNSDKECLVEKRYSSYSRVIKRHGEHDRSNRSSWRSSSDVDFGCESRSRSSSINDNEYWLKYSPRNSASPSLTSAVEAKDECNGKGELEDDDSLENSSSENSYSVRRRIKTWFGSFGKGNKAAKRRDSTFYVDPESDNNNSNNKSMWETTSNSSGEEKIYTSVDTSVDEAIKDDRLLVNGNSQPVTDAEKKKRKAFYVVKELISSEKVFIDVLNLLIVEFVQFVKGSDIPKNELDKIINYLPQLCSFNKNLLEDLESRISNWEEMPKISDIIIKKGPFLKLFSAYIQDFEKQCSLLDECYYKYHRFSKLVKEFEALEQCKKLTLKHYMLKPVQRLPQYRLLLEEYLSYQDEESIDYDDTHRALKIVCDAAEHANRSVEQGMHLSKLLQIQAQLGNFELIKPGREFVKSGDLYKVSRKVLHLRHFILLSDCLLYTGFYGSRFSLTVKDKLPFANMKVNVPQSDDHHNEFSVISTTRSFTLRARSAEEREQWVSALEKTIKEYNRKQLSFVNSRAVSMLDQIEPIELGKEAPVWVPDARVTMCQICTAEFKVTFRRHHCRACGKVVCANCSDNKAPLHYMNFRAARVCDECYQKLSDEFSDLDSSLMKEITHHADLNDADAAAVYNNIKGLFKKHDPQRTKKLHNKYVRSWLQEVAASDPGALVSGWLHRRKQKSWKKYWFVLKDQVLYVYHASADVKAFETIPVLGYVIETFKEGSVTYEDIDSKLVFQLAHANQSPLVFYADTETTAERWIAALKEAVSIS